MTELAIHEARATLAKHARTFRLASWFLPAGSRDEAAIVYTLCRTIDDVVDEEHDPDAIVAIREEIRGLRSPRPVVASFLRVAEARGIPLKAALDLVEGCESDLGHVRIADEAALVRYAQLVAGTVGQMMAPLLGARDPVAEGYAVDLGVAMQLTNIARDVAEDAGRDRVYLPATWLAEAGVSPEEVARGTADREATFRVVRRLVTLADIYYHRGDLGLPYLPFRARIAIGVASRVYRAIGLAVVRRGPPALADRTVLSGWERVRHALSGIAVAVRPEAA